MWRERDFAFGAFDGPQIISIVDMRVTGRYVLPATLSVLDAFVRGGGVCAYYVIENVSFGGTGPVRLN
jgi:hypothetical protein